jgi:glycosyltransferase involved in cell wall biosynthesis
VKISAVIIAFDEEENIADAINSVAWADEVLVVDSESTDETRAIAESLKAKVLTQKWQGFSRQKQFAVDNAAHDWIFSLDADERVSNRLKDEILKLKNQPENSLAPGYKIPRLTFYMNRWIRHGGWYPDWQLRFFNRRKGKWKDILIHESVEMQENARVEKLSGDILHYSIPDAAYHNKMIADRYAPLAAEQMFRRDRSTSPFKIFTAGIIAFLQTYILKLGFLDGLAGFCIARFAAHHAFLKHLLLWEMQQNPNSKHQTQKSEIAKRDL